MSRTFRVTASILMLSSMLALAACGSGSNTDSAAGTETAAPTAAAGGGEAAATASPSPAATATAAPAEATSAPTAAPEASAPADAPDTAKELKELLHLAEQGRAPGIKYAAHTGLIDDVKAAWGKPDVEESAGSGIYATYKSKDAVIGFNKGSRIFDVRSSAADLQKLTLKQIEAVLGQPEDTKTNGGDTIYIYPAGKQFQLKFIIPESTGTVDHISVFSPKDSFNNMAG
ncbi:YjgB family protein [Paenibacillus sp. NFR01]|uniref:YjgB family protein n=1 Tax=Paenibacillus sp. NFR01 TaxID=1566279 RepID=UPI0008BA677C|nr:YjgB family protein [Paenibacillus sp. NFR01]SET96822.1 protein of unknown function [Paenibacillus sp. NFR01]